LNNDWHVSEIRSYEGREFEDLIQRADDYAFEERRKKLWQRQPLQWWVWPMWITTGLLVAVWVRILWLTSREILTYLVARFGQ
jgi:hypothetical protein